MTCLPESKGDNLMSSPDVREKTTGRMIRLFPREQGRWIDNMRR
jgi:hypothetical protein